MFYGIVYNLSYFKDGLSPRKLERQWHIGNEVPDFFSPFLQDDVKICEVQADGDELEALYNTFPNLPRANDRRIVRFHGDWARFILENL